MEFTFLSDALISLIPTYGPWIIFGVVALESAGVPLLGETILVSAALVAATTAQINIVVVVLDETAAPCPRSTLLIEIATITARGLAGQPMKCGAERARLAEADIKCNFGYGRLTIRQ